MPEIVNLQRKISIDRAPIRAFVNSVTDAIAEAGSGEFCVALISDRRMTELNRFFRGKDSTTDVLSFPYKSDEFVQGASFSLSNDNSEQAEAGPLKDEFLGDIVISVEQAERQANENGLTLENEIKQLILHGLLHLCGYDHEIDDGEMNKRELELRRKLKV